MSGSGVPATRLRSRHRRFSQEGADRGRLLGSFALSGLGLVGAAVWAVTDHGEVAIAWVAGALLLAGYSWWDHRRRVPADLHWSLRGEESLATIAHVLLAAGVIAVTARYGLGQDWASTLVLSLSATLMALFSSWQSARRSRRYLERRRAELRPSPGAPPPTVP